MTEAVWPVRAHRPMRVAKDLLAGCVQPERARAGGLAALAVALAMLASAPPALAQAAAPAARYFEVASAAAVLYDAPSERARKLFIVVRGTPLEQVAVVNKWVKVRDLGGDVLWIERGELGPARHVVAGTLAALRRTPQANGELIAQVERGVLLEVVDAGAPAGWLHVRHRDGSTGYVAAAETWGR